MENTKRILIITYKYFPEIAPRVFRWQSIAEEWVKKGIGVDVICAAVPGTPETEVINAINVHRIIPWLKKNSFVQKNQINVSQTASNILPCDEKNLIIEEIIKNSEVESTSAEEIISASEDESSLIEETNSNSEDKIRTVAENITNSEGEVSITEEKTIDFDMIAPADEIMALPEGKKTFFHIVQWILWKSCQLIKKLVWKTFHLGKWILWKSYHLVRKLIWKTFHLIKKGLWKFKNLIKRILKKFRNDARTSKSKLAKRINGAKKNIRTYQWPDYGMPWIPPAYRLARKLIKQNHYSAIISVSWPVSPHVVGWWINRTFGKKLNWIVDIGDPYSFNTTTPINDFKKFQKLNTDFERKLLSRATSVSVTTEKTKEDYIEFLPAVKEKIHVFPPLVPVSKKVSSRSKKFLTENSSPRTQLIFTGSLRRNNRRPDALLHLFNQLLLEPGQKEHLELHFYGDNKQCLASFEPYLDLIDKNIFLHGIVKKEFVDNIIHNADFLVNIGNVTENQLPSKTVEYVSTNRPIINLSASEADSSWEIFSVSGMAINIIAKTPEDITHKQVELVHDFLANPPKPMSAAKLKKLIKPYSTETISQEYLTIID